MIMKTISCIVFCLAFVLAAVSAGTAAEVPGPNPDLPDVFNHAAGFGSDPDNPVRVAKSPTTKHHGHITVLKLYEPGTGGPGGSLGGEVHTFSASDGAIFRIDMFDADDPDAPRRIINIPIDGIIETGPRTPGDAVQDFDTEMVQLQGSLFGDPDFDTLRVTAGSNFGLPSAGHTTLTQLPSGNFTVDSFFDLTYEIDWQGASGGILDGLSGTESGTTRFGLGHTFDPAVPEPGGLGLAGLAFLVLRKKRS